MPVPLLFEEDSLSCKETFPSLQQLTLTSQYRNHRGFVFAGYAAVHGSHTGRYASYRSMVDLHVPLHHNDPEKPFHPALHSRTLQEEPTLHSPKVPTFSLFSALHDSVLGVVRATATQHACAPQGSFI